LETVLVVGELRIIIHTAECGHVWAHVHVRTPDGEIVIFLDGDHPASARGPIKRRQKLRPV
jgi:hypothetical protein